MKYIFSTQKSNPRFVNIEFVVETRGETALLLHLPAWRPGRYELGNFAKNIQRFEIFDEQDKPVPFKKKTKDSWLVESKDRKEIHVKYNYYANQLDAGACWADHEQLYINPVHCCLFVPERKNESCILELHVPKDFITATSLVRSSPSVSFPEDEKISVQSFFASDFDELVDSPFISSPLLKHHRFELQQTSFHLWFMGECKPDFQKIVRDFKGFINDQFEMYGSFPFGSDKNDYHFLFQITPFSSYHGVEHLNSTVIALGPSYDLMEGIYKEFLGISSHELFHAWNIKTIRPVEMMPYDYTKENYSRLGFVAEGVTTYYGDVHLLRSRVYSEDDFFSRIAKQVQKHFDNPGRLNSSVADSSFDTWLDGYVPGTQGRKVSIYTEGCLCAMMLDLMIRRETRTEKSLDDVMVSLYNNFGKKKLGYSEENYSQTVKSVSGNGFEDFFGNYVFGTKDYKSHLTEMLDYAGMELKETPSSDYCESDLGFRHSAISGGAEKIAAIAAGSPAENSGLLLDDEIISVNEIKVESNINKWCKYFSGSPLRLLVSRKNQIHKIEINPGNAEFFSIYSIVRKPTATEQQKKNYLSWTKNPF